MCVPLTLALSLVLFVTSKLQPWRNTNLSLSVSWKRSIHLHWTHDLDIQKSTRWCAPCCLKVCPALPLLFCLTQSGSFLFTFGKILYSTFLAQFKISEALGSVTSSVLGPIVFKLQNAAPRRPRAGGHAGHRAAAERAPVPRGQARRRVGISRPKP